ncbi:unnamed protein product [Polarella glacialis]|uniref:Uncharacterized protein n=1 Tax=Polarella glacialis TaxID=89957 RepID=A0A813INH8_POLGL|nr:unnamed protein product [Polarella glacialis]
MCLSENIKKKKTIKTNDASSALLDLRGAQGLLDVGQRHIPVHLAEHFVHVALLGHKESALAIRHGLEEITGQAAGAHLSCKSHPALGVIHHLLNLIYSVASAALDKNIRFFICALRPSMPST